MPRGREKLVLYLPLHLVQPGPCAGAGPVMELAADIRRAGIRQPLTVCRTEGRYVVLSGRRRYLAARAAGLRQIPCLEAGTASRDPVLMELREQLCRTDLPYFREAELLEQYLLESGMTQARAAAELGRSQSAIANKLRLRQLSPELRKQLGAYGLSERHARALLTVPEEGRAALARRIAEEHLTVARTEELVRRLDSEG